MDIKVKIYNIEGAYVDTGCIVSLSQEIEVLYKENKLMPIRVKIGKSHNIVKEFYRKNIAEVVFSQEGVTFLIPMFDSKKIIIIDNNNYRLFEMPKILHKTCARIK